MLKAIFYSRKNNSIIYVINNCLYSNGNYIGDNTSITEPKLNIFGIKWTEDIIEPVLDKDGNQIGWSKTLDEITDAKTYNYSVVSTREDVNKVVTQQIRNRYSLEDELKIHRMKLLGDETEWNEYQQYISTILADAKKYKDENFPKIEGN
jgi:hypothetical protein